MGRYANKCVEKGDITAENITKMVVERKER